MPHFRLQTFIAGCTLFYSSLMSQPLELSTIGNVYPSCKSAVGSQVAGRVDRVLIEIGQAVQAGQPLIVIDPLYFEIDLAQKKNALESAKIELADAETNFSRMKRLWDKQDGQSPSVTLKKFEEAKLKYDQSLVQVKHCEEECRRAQVDLDETIIRAPFNGTVTKKCVDKGESITDIPVTCLLEIQSMTPVYLEFSLPQAYLNAIHVGTPIQFEIEGTGQANQQAKIDLIYPHLDERTRSVRCRAVLDNQDRKILPGSLAKVTIAL